MNIKNIALSGIIVLFVGYYSYTVFLADDALIKRTEINKDEKGGYVVETKLLNGKTLIETYEVTEKGSPLSHTLAVLDPATGDQPKPIKSGKFVPKY